MSLEHAPTVTDPTTSDYDRATTLTATDDGWTVDLDGTWSIGGFMNGGYLLAAMVKAVVVATQRPDPLAVTATFLSPPAAGPADLQVAIAKRGRQSTVADVSLRQGDREHVRATCVLGDLDTLEGPALNFPAATIPPLADCVSLADRPGPGGIERPAIFRHFDVCLARRLRWLEGVRANGVPDGPALIEGWTRFADGRPADVVSLMLFADAFPPAVLDVFPAGWVPTLQYSVYVRARPEPGWIGGSFRTRSVVDGLLEEDGELFDETGRLLAQSRQLALLRPPA